MDTRYWSFFVWLIGTVILVVGFATPYEMIGNRVSIKVAFGGDVLPDGVRIGLWGDVPDELQSTIMAVRAVLCISLAFVFLTLIGYILLFTRQSTIMQVITIIANFIAGILVLIAGFVYRAASDELGEGYWLCTMSGGVFLVNGIVLIFMPVMEYSLPNLQSHDIQLTNYKKKATKV